ncbi:MAG: outer membrane protein assembly factor BamC, partial [Luminiphilus sp.]
MTSSRVGLLLLPWLLVLGGCSWIYGEDGLFPDNTDRYQEAPELAVIEVPEDVSTVALDATYPIPDVQQSFLLESEFEVPRPTPLTGSNAYDTVRIQRLGDESWALVAVAPGQLWPQVRAFLTSSQIGVAGSDAESGLIDTQYVTLQDRPLPTRFRFQV